MPRFAKRLIASIRRLWRVRVLHHLADESIPTPWNPFNVPGKRVPQRLPKPRHGVVEIVFEVQVQIRRPQLGAQVFSRAQFAGLGEQSRQKPRGRILQRHPDAVTFQFSRRRVEAERPKSDTFKVGVICAVRHGLYYTGMRLAIGVVVLVCFSFALCAQDVLKMPVVYTVPGMDAVEVTKGLNYGSDAPIQLQMDVYRPANLKKDERRPAVLFLHGGGGTGPVTASAFPPTAWGVYQSYGRLMGASGLIGVTFNQRIGDSDDRLQQGFSDVRAAIAYVRANAATLHVDPDRLCLAAYSAGGPLLAVAIGDPQPYLRCLVGFYSVLDVRPPVTGERALFSPIEQLKLHADKLPPILIARAGSDFAQLNATIDRFAAEALSRDVAVEVHNMKGAPHAFDVRTPTAEVRDVIARTVAFMKANLEK